MRKRILYSSGILISILLLSVFVQTTSGAPRNNPIFATIDYVQEKIDDLRDEFEFRFQNNESDIDLLKSLARRIGFRVSRLEEREISLSSIYHREFGPYTAEVGIPYTVVYGCDNGDIVLSGGMHRHGGDISNWRLVRNHPGADRYHNMKTTVINENETNTFYLIARCLDISPE